jgi:hypothetical protein
MIANIKSPLDLLSQPRKKTSKKASKKASKKPEGDPPPMNTRFADLGGAVFASSPTDYAKLIADETDKWAKVIKFAGIKVE